MDTYEDLEARIDAQQGSVVFSLKQLFFGAEAIDVEETKAQRAAVQERFESVHGRAVTLRDRAADAMETSRETGESLPESLDVSVETVRSRSEDVASFRSENTQYLRADEHEELRDVASTLSDQARYLRVKGEFDAAMAEAEPTVTALLDDAGPYLEYDAYLTSPAETRIRERIPTARNALDDVRASVDVGALSDGDRERLGDLDSRIDAAAELLDGYNDRFVARQRAAYESLFTDVDEAGHDLNDAQQRAVVRNGYLNQVVAGAGTGKTFALIYRVAYLVGEGVDPSRIVALTYTTEAAREMEDRLETEFGITTVEVRTIHSFAYKIAQETGDGTRSVAQSQDTYNLVADVIDEEEGGDSEFADHYLQFLYHYDDDFLDETDFHERTDYIAERREATYETLNGETVASRAEKVIADFLFTNRVTYRYESIAEWADTAEDKQPYRPDFYLPEYEIYIEHWGLDANGEVAPWFSWTTEQYLEKLHWARGEFARNDPDLIDTYDFEYQRGRLERALRHRLIAAGVPLDRMAFEEFVDEAFEYDRKRRDIEESFTEFIGNAKTFDVSPEEIPARLSRRKPRQYHFGQCGRELLERYDDYLRRNDLMDFDDMIYDAIEAIERDPAEFQERYDHFLVDEFQDVAMSQIRLIHPFVGEEADTRLFCVGDDWQSIYSFQGSQVSYFVNFGDHFGPPAPVRTRLTANYRCPATVIEASNSLIRNNQDQIEKDVEAHSGRDSQPVLHTLDGYHDSEYERRVGTYAADLVEECLASGSDPGDVMVLCRYDGGAPYLDTLKEELRGRDVPYDGKDDVYRPPDMPGEGDDDFDDEAGVSAFSVHQSKGREAKHVVLLHAVTGPFGFPPDERDDDLLAPVQDVDTNTMAEERRLFYVAVTRATHDLHVVTRSNQESPFVDEMAEFFREEQSLVSSAEEGDRVSVTARVARLWDDPHPKQQQAGVLEDRTGSCKFVAWKSDGPPEVAADTWYRFDGLRIDEYQGERQFVLEGSTSVVELYRERGPGESVDGSKVDIADAGRETASNGSGTTESVPRSSDGTGSTSGTGASETDGGGPPPTIVGGPDVSLSYADIDKDGSPIGRGGEAVVHGGRIHTDGKDRYVALKEPDQRETLHAETVERFLDEAEVWEKLAEHDHVVDVLGWGSQPLPWIAMEYMDGGNLRSRLGSLPFDQTVWTVLGITRAIRHAHNRGVRHYDLKPENVLFRSVADGYWDVPKVADWGLAEQALRQRGGVEGVTPAYAAPEQLFPEYGDPDHRTDVYQLGLLSYELFTGHHPYDGDQTQVESASLTPPSHVAESLPSAVDDVLATALAVDPDDRYEDILDLRRGLDDLVERF
jgi:DNA helicase-4